MTLLTDTTSTHFKQFISSLPRGKEVVRDMIAADLAAHEAAIAAVQALLANAQGALSALAIAALPTDDFVEDQRFIAEDTGILYYFEPGGSGGVFDADDAGGTYHYVVADDVAILPIAANVAGAKGRVSTGYLGGEALGIRAVDVDGVTTSLVYVYDIAYDASGFPLQDEEEPFVIIPDDVWAGGKIGAFVNSLHYAAEGGGGGEGALIHYAFPMRTPPVGATIGQKCIVADSGTSGVFVGQEGKLATVLDDVAGTYTFEDIENGDKFYADTAAWSYSGASLNLTGLRNPYAEGPSRTSGIFCFSTINDMPLGGEAINRAYFVDGLGGGAWGVFTNKIVYLDGDGATWLDAGYTMPDGALIAECTTNGAVLATYSGGIVWYEAGTSGGASAFDQTGGVGRISGTISKNILEDHDEEIGIELFLAGLSPSAVAAPGTGTRISPAADLERVVIMCASGSFEVDVTGTTGTAYVKIGTRIEAVSVTITL